MAAFQNWFQKYVWDSRSLNDPSVPINGSTLDALWAGGATESGENVNAGTALTFSAVHRANRLICDIMGYLPINVMQNNSDGSKGIAKDHPAQYLLHHQPNNLMSSFTWREAMQGNLNFRGNAYSEITGSSFSDPGSFKFHSSDNVEPKIHNDSLVYLITERDGIRKRTVLAENMIHIPGFGFNGIVGLSTIDIARESFGAAIATQKSASRFFKNDSTPGGILFNKGATEEQRKAAKQAWESTQKGKNKGKTAVMPGEWEYKQVTVTPEQSQFLQTRAFSVVEISRWFGVPPHLLFELDRATFSNIEHQQLQFLIYTLNGWINRWEQELNRKLFTIQDRLSEKFFVKFNVNAILRTDIKARSDFYRTLWSVGALSTNDILDLEDMNKIEGGDKHMVQQGFVDLKIADQVALGNKQNGSN